MDKITKLQAEAFVLMREMESHQIQAEQLRKQVQEKSAEIAELEAKVAEEPKK